MNFPFVELPTGYEPRAAFPLLFGAIAGVLYNLFLDLKFLKQDLDSLSNLLQKTNEKYEPSRLLKENLAKQLAKKWLDVVPIFISEYSCLGMRMKGQMNENSKKIAFYDVFPEMMHNTTQSWKDVQLNLLPLHFIRIVIHENTEMSDKTNYGLELAHYKSLSQVDELDFSQTSKNLLEKLFLATYLVDYASIYIAFLKDVDPSFIDIVVGMKDKFEPILNKQYDIRLALLEMV
jgi:glucose/mannose-6-phosphate isomerase